jgi:hypothetical protein
MTAGQRLSALAGSGTAGVLLLLIGSGATAGAALVNYSGLPSGTAAQHLLVDHVGGTLAERLEALLNPLASGKSWPLVAAQGTLSPYIIYQDVISVTSNTLGGATNLQRTRMQIDAYDATESAAQSLAKNIIAAMATATFSNIKIAEHHSYDADAMLYRVLLEFSIWA